MSDNMRTHHSTVDSRQVQEHVTHSEIFQQPEVWPTTLERVQNSGLMSELSERSGVVFSGAGTSAYAAAAISSAWPGSHAISSTDLLVATPDELARSHPQFIQGGLLVSLSRSGQSRESTAVVAKFQRQFPTVEHLAITCNAGSQLVTLDGVRGLVLDPRANDQGLAMTCSFTNLVLAGLCLRHGDLLAQSLPAICTDVQHALPELDRIASSLALSGAGRAVVLASGDLKALADEICLKILEMTAGSVSTLSQTFLGLRHGPMSFLRPDSLVLCFLSSHAGRRRYEEDLVEELERKQLGRIVVIGPRKAKPELSDTHIRASATELPDYLRVPFEVPVGQLLAYHLSMRCGLDPDNPSPENVITRVVQDFRLHDETASV
jgi:tagatose-6-phosphate ketose/aldose isomerase